MKILKKLVCICLLVMCLTGAICESALDLSRLSDDELTALLTQVQTEVASRGIEKTATLPSGKYTGGEDIPAGVYMLHCKPAEGESGIVWLSAASDDLDNEYPSILYEYLNDDDDETYRVKIEEGGVLNLPYGAELTISAGVIFK